MSRRMENAERKGQVIFTVEVLVKPDYIFVNPDSRWPKASTNAEQVKIIRDLADAIELDDHNIAELWNIKRFSKEKSWEII